MSRIEKDEIFHEIHKTLTKIKILCGQTSQISSHDRPMDAILFL